MNKTPAKGWYSRGYLPHFDNRSRTQFITYRLADSLPQRILRGLRSRLEREKITDRELLIKIDKYLDKGLGECHLGKPEIAIMVEENLLHFDGKKYKLHSWVIMPNHVHLLLTPKDRYSLSEITHSAKSYSSSKANKILKREARFWFPEVFDRYIRDDEHFEKTWKYIELNPVTAGLCKHPYDGRFSSAWWRKNRGG
ncbi:MAG: transposase [Pyrinomonadaceae bacterium]